MHQKRTVSYDRKKKMMKQKNRKEKNIRQRKNTFGERKKGKKGVMIMCNAFHQYEREWVIQ